MDDSDLSFTAELACIALTEEEFARLRGEVASMVANFEKMKELDVSGLEPTTHALARGNRTRVDVVGTAFIADEILEQAPDLEDRFICIPNVL